MYIGFGPVCSACFYLAWSALPLIVFLRHTWSHLIQTHAWVRDDRDERLLVRRRDSAHGLAFV